MQTTALGLITGLIVGLAWAFGNFGDGLIVLVLGLVGYFIGKALDGDLDLSSYLGGGSRGRRQ